MIKKLYTCTDGFIIVNPSGRFYCYENNNKSVYIAATGLYYYRIVEIPIQLNCFFFQIKLIGTVDVDFLKKSKTKIIKSKLTVSEQLQYLHQVMSDNFDF